MSDQYIGQKMVEEEQLHDFLEAYEEVTGEALENIGGGERPDFIAVRPDGEQVRHDPGEADLKQAGIE